MYQKTSPKTYKQVIFENIREVRLFIFWVLANKTTEKLCHDTLWHADFTSVSGP